MTALYILSTIFIASPFLPATKHPHWFFRTADFIRLQSIVVQMLLITLLFIFIEDYTWAPITVLVGLFAAMLYQIVKVMPYSALYPRSAPQPPSDGSFSILAGNVLQDNTEHSKFVSLVKDHDPDLVLLMESDTAWEQGISEIEATYAHSVKIAKDNYYGMHLYAKEELKNKQICYHVEEGVPSILVEYKLNKTTPVFICCLHPAPPSPTENETSKERDAELMIVGKKIRQKNMPAVVCGDMNDVVWSRIARLFKKMTGMVDPRTGRGFFPTYHAGHWFMRFPLDHLFHTKDLYVGKMKRTKNFGSDHFAMYYEIHHKKKAVTPPTPVLNGEDRATIKNKIGAIT